MRNAFYITNNNNKHYLHVNCMWLVVVINIVLFSLSFILFILCLFQLHNSFQNFDILGRFVFYVFLFCFLLCLLNVRDPWSFTIIRWPFLYVILVVLVSNMNVFNTIMGKKCTYVSIFVFGFVFWVSLFLS
jgi:hypothetical protein